MACKEGSSEMHSSFCDLQQRKQGTAGHISKIYHQCQFVSCSELVSSVVRVAENFSHFEITTERQSSQAWRLKTLKCDTPPNIQNSKSENNDSTDHIDISVKQKIQEDHNTMQN